MFLAKTWKTVKGKRYTAWVLKASVWDREARRQRQRYLAYIGKEKRISGEKAKQICAKLGITLAELRKVKGLRIDPSPGHVSVESDKSDVKQDSTAILSEDELSIPEMIRALRTHHSYGRLQHDYEALAIRIGTFYVSTVELQDAEAGRAELSPDAQWRVRYLWSQIPAEQEEDESGEDSPISEEPQVEQEASEPRGSTP